jgi:hypothetical protein
LRIVDVLHELSDGLGIGVALEDISTLLQNKPELAAVGDYAVMNDAEFVLVVGAMRVAVALRGSTVGCPAGVGDGNLRHKDFLDVDGAPRDLLPQASNLSNFLEVDDLAWLVAINTESGRVVSSVLLARKSSAEDLKDLLAALLLQKTAVAKDTTHRVKRKLRRKEIVEVVREKGEERWPEGSVIRLLN